MSTSKELRERFAPKEAKNTSISPEMVNHALGIVTEDLRDVITGDISAMLKQGGAYRRSIDGYIFCLSRIMDHKKAWDYITEAFRSQGEKVPTKYYQQFGQEQEAEIKHNKLVGE